MTKSRLKVRLEKRRVREVKAFQVLHDFTPGEIQAYAYVETQFKRGRRRGAPIYKGSRKVKGTGIPASTIKRIQDGIYNKNNLSLKTINKLSKFYDRYMYWELLRVGARHREARIFKKWSPERLRNVIGQYNQWSGKIKENRRKVGVKVSQAAIAWGMCHSTNYGYNDWKFVVMTSGLEKKKVEKRKKKRSRQWEH